MIFYQYPDVMDSKYDNVTKKLYKELRKKNRFDHILKIKSTLKKIEEVIDLQPFFDSEQILPIQYKTGLYEIRCPKTRKDGVCRIYWMYHPQIGNGMIFLDAEYKPEKKANRIDSAESRRKEVLNFLKNKK